MASTKRALEKEEEERGAEMYSKLCEIGYFERKHVTAVFSETYDRVDHPDSSKRDTVEVEFRRRKASNPRIFNATKFRFATVNIEKDRNLHLNLGKTDYASFLGTNMNQAFRGVRERKYLADPLGVNVVLETQDRKIVLIRRSRHVATHQGLFDLPGGHAEPSRVKHLSSSLENSVSVVDEIFESIRLEVRDECGVPVSNILDQAVLTVLRVNGTAGNANVCFRMRTDLTSKKIRALYEKGDFDEAYESTELAFLDIAKIDEADRSEWTEITKATISVWLRARALRKTLN